MKAKTEPANVEGLHLEPAEVQKLIAGREPLQIIEVREYPEFAAGHIASALHVPLNSLEARCHDLDRKTSTVCVCQSGMRSAQARGDLGQARF